MSVLGAGEAFMMASGEEAYQISRSLRFNSGDSSSLSRTPASAGNRKTWTLSWWMKLGKLGGNFGLFGMPGTSSGQPQFYSRIGTDNKLYVYDYNSSGTYQFVKKAEAVLRDPSAWYHCIFQYDSTQSTAEDGFKIYVNGERITSWTTNTLTDYAQNYEGPWNSVANTGVHIIGQSDGYFDGYLADVHFVDGTALTPTDFGEYDDNNVWIAKKFTGSYGANGFHLDFSDNSSNAALGTDSSGNNNTWTVNNLTASVSNPSYDSTHGSNITSTEAAKIFDSDDSTYGVATGNFVGFAYGGSSVKMKVENTSSGQVSFYIQPNVSNNAVNSGTWGSQSAGTVSSNQWYIPATTTATATFTFPATWDGDGRIYTSGNESSLRFYSMDATAGDLAGIDSLIDTPTNYEAGSGNNGGNYCTLNPLTKTVATLSDGNLLYEPHGSTQHCVGSTMAVASGKWYWEYTIETTGTYHYAGIADVATNYTGNWCGSNSGWSVSVNTSGNISYNNAENHGAIGTSPASGQTWGWALDMDAGTLKVYINGSIQYSGNSIIPSSTSLAGRTITPAAGHSAHKNLTFNFGQRSFAYTPPTGYKSLCTTNLPDPTIADGSTAMDVKLWTGDDATSRAITGLNFSPDLLWIKSRSSSGWHVLADNLRGAGKILASNATNSEYDNTDSQNAIQSFDSNGFTIGDQGSWLVNDNNITTVGWAWDAGSSNTSISAGGLNSSAYDQSRTWSNDLSATNLADQTKMFDWTYGYGSYTGTCTWTTTNSAYSNLSGRVYLANNTTVGLGITFKDSGGNSLGTFTVAWTGDGTQMQDTGFDWSSSVASVEITGNYLPVRVQIGNKTIVDTGVTVPNVPLIASTVRANPTAGFSIVSYAGHNASGTVGHGLNAEPYFIIVKNRDVAEEWVVYHKDIGNTKDLVLNSPVASNVASHWNDTTPTSLVISLGYTGSANESGSNYLGYAWAPVSDFSSFGSFTGNGSTDGPFVYTGFKPKWIMVKRTDGNAPWVIVDTERNTFNVMDDHLLANDPAAENGSTIGNVCDSVSNGFKLRGSDGWFNGNNANYVYASFASHPFKNSPAR